MMKKLLLSSAFFCISALMYAQTAVTETKTVQATQPQQVISISEETHDFGKIPQGKPVHTEFVVENKSKEPLKINNVQASCGCTTPEWEKDKPVAAGQKTTIKVGYNAQAEGPFTKAITITYNDNLTKVITIKGEVWKTPASSAPENSGVNELKN